MTFDEFESITHELRAYVGKSKGMFTDYVLAIADRIDAEHERQLEVVAHRHVKPDTWEHIINDAFGATTMNDEVRASFVARCKALAGEGDGKPLRHLASHEALRARIDECCAKIEAASENAKLRKMLRDMRYCIKRNHRCDDCDFNVGTDCLLFVNINKRMRELGVEEN